MQKDVITVNSQNGIFKKNFQELCNHTPIICKSIELQIRVYCFSAVNTHTNAKIHAECT